VARALRRANDSMPFIIVVNGILGPNDLCNNCQKNMVSRTETFAQTWCSGRWCSISIWVICILRHVFVLLFQIVLLYKLETLSCDYYRLRELT